MNTKSQSGFTLIELMIVIAIIGILAAIAIPSYNEYVAKAQAGEAYTLLAGKKTPMAEFYGDTGRWPSSVAAVADQGSSGAFIAIVTISSGANSTGPVELTADIRNTEVSAYLRGRSIQLTSTRGTTWTCFSNDVDDRFLPSACR